MKRKKAPPLTLTTLGDQRDYQRALEKDAANGHRLLIIRSAPLGDFVLTAPMLMTLRNAHPNCRIDMLCATQHGRMFTDGGLIDGFYDLWDPLLRPTLWHGAADQYCCRFFSSYDIICSYIHDPDRYIRQACSKPNRVLFSHRAGFLGAVNEHASLTILQPLIKCGYVPCVTSPWLKFSHVSATKHPYVVVHPHSGNSANHYPLEHWLRVLKRILFKTEFDIVITCGPGDATRTDALMDSIKHPRISTLRDASLSVVGSAIQHAHSYVGQDSGVSHLASAVATPSLIYWGTAVLTTWRPSGPCVKVIKHAEATEIDRLLLTAYLHES